MESRKHLTFASAHPFLEEELPDAREVKNSRHDYLMWGSGNDYPNYLAELYESCTTLRTIISGCVDFVGGNDVQTPETLRLNRRGMSGSDLVRALARDAYMYGGFAIEVIRTKDREGIAEIYPLEIRNLRMNKEASVFYYSENWGEKYRRFDEVGVYPAFEDGAKHPSSILLVKLDGLGVYPSPSYASAVKDCEIERMIDDFHISSLTNGFASSYIVNFNNGRVTDEEKAEIEEAFNEKFAGYKNAGRVMLSWNDDKENATTLTELKVEDFGVKYEALAKHCRQQIFAAFRAVPSLFGIMTEQSGFSEQEFREAFRLFNRTRVKPVQSAIVDAVARVYGVDVLTIIPFSLDSESEGTI